MTSRHPKPRQVVQPLKAHLKPTVLPDILLKDVSERNSEKKTTAEFGGTSVL
jgi:hypothetical protein